MQEKDVEAVDFSDIKNKKVTVEGDDFFAPVVIICTGAEVRTIVMFGGNT